MMQRMHQILDSFSRKVSKAKRARTLNQSVKPVQVNGNGTNGYLIKSGKNKGKILATIRFSLEPICICYGQRISAAQKIILET